MDFTASVSSMASSYCFLSIWFINKFGRTEGILSVILTGMINITLLNVVFLTQGVNKLKKKTNISISFFKVYFFLYFNAWV